MLEEIGDHCDPDDEVNRDGSTEQEAGEELFPSRQEPGEYAADECHHSGDEWQVPDGCCSLEIGWLTVRVHMREDQFAESITSRHHDDDHRDKADNSDAKHGESSLILDDRCICNRRR